MRALRLTGSVAARLALGNGLLLILVIGLISGVFYFGTVGVLARSMDGKIIAISNRLTDEYARRPVAELVQEINHELADGIDSDTEIFLVTAADGHRLAGNLSTWPTGVPLGQLLDGEVIRDERPVSARLLVQRLSDGGLVYVGRDLNEQRAIRQLVLRALEGVMAVSLVLVALGALLLRHQIERRIGGIRHTAREIESGNLQQRIAVSGDDEFARLGVDINRMLDRIEQLMNGVRHVSNTIAHDLRTPMGRVRARLDEVLRREAGLPALTEAARGAIEGIDDLIVMLNKLLRIAEAESGVRTDTFERVNLNSIVHDMAELYDAAAEQAGVRLVVLSHEAVWGHGDHDLLANAVASLIDNALKYAGRGAVVELAAGADAQRAFITVRDNGPGVPESELPRLTERFYRVDRSRSQPGNGLGLSIVAATATLHGGSFELRNAEPGLRATLRLPHAGPPAVEISSATRAEKNDADEQRWDAADTARRVL
jgi:signal transduction histidine kinase